MEVNAVRVLQGSAVFAAHVRRRPGPGILAFGAGPPGEVVVRVHDQPVPGLPG